VVAKRRELEFRRRLVVRGGDSWNADGEAELSDVSGTCSPEGALGSGEGDGVVGSLGVGGGRHLEKR